MRTYSNHLTLRLSFGVIVFLIVALLAAPGRPSYGQNEASVDPNASAIQSVYDDINTAFECDHIDRIPDYLSQDYTETDPHGQVLDVAAAMRKLHDERDQIVTIQSQMSIVSVTSTNTGLLVEMKLHSIGTGQKRVMWFKVHGTFTNDLVVRDLWIDTPDGWRIKSRIKLVDDSRVQAA